MYIGRFRNKAGQVEIPSAQKCDRQVMIAAAGGRKQGLYGLRHGFRFESERKLEWPATAAAPNRGAGQRSLACRPDVL